ncbi:hypothetical protein C8Q77DRAFT_1220061 [Trametes polyzona]|nr:hypothetical protein C8Q77DRAFT_1220061 [Trametes polyzona]
MRQRQAKTFKGAVCEGCWPLHHLHKENLAYTAEADESVLFYDPEGNLIASVRNVVSGVLAKKSVSVYSTPPLQLDNLGFLANVSFTAGNCKDPKGFGWVCNLCYARDCNDPLTTATLEHCESLITAFFWNMECGSLLDEYSLCIPSGDLLVLSKLHLGTVEVAPLPATRSVRRSECLAGPITCPHGPTEDGNSVIPDYHFKIDSAANPCSWLPTLWHGTTLRHLSFEDLAGSCLAQLRLEPKDKLGEDGEEWEEEVGPEWDRGGE